ncbi:heat shock protein DnaJ domain protein (plasmid) [Pseudarthrobacter chlorophenolicus A6]|uniref:Heat shock protein DnaJ domain protein n=1 Tax=Pseudarthrobacter chlorophenolicus (strain ATCC 700700 / DSM 12829 / CIP 107037 / JCM 12360 / KCTC 9906 / NCIMB 13794 / A6) TaxID=452863 RepID=B8HJ30_PSECP|nr:J domain-containing protein [Pseudarthrobacter chlorophenolicus]ACL42427.1 heat shock protein DnaJ domain protein [Pseudarthrobacter chlorophenolicus A6]SDQ17986.1 DnaJ domain-containing protein [Pseudarthrobacter chlorophenolicus]
MNRYEVLGIKTDATPEEIKRAYRKLAAKTHPDVAGAVMAPLFLSVQDAYETLSDPNKRAAYDREINPAPQAEAEPPPAAQWPPPQQYRQDPIYEREAYPEPEPPGPAPSHERDALLRRLKFGAIGAFFVGVGSFWVFHWIQVFQLVQPEGPIRLFATQGLPAIVYAVLWAFGTAVASMADDVGTALKMPLTCAVIAGGFAFITATWIPAAWLPVLIAGLALTSATAFLIRRSRRPSQQTW